MKVSLLSLSPLPPPQLQPQPLHNHRRSNRFNLRACSTSSNHRVVVTRERGKNDKLITALGKHGIESLELPLIQHSHLPDLDKLVSLLSSNFLSSVFSCAGCLDLHKTVSLIKIFLTLMNVTHSLYSCFFTLSQLLLINLILRMFSYPPLDEKEKVFFWKIFRKLTSNFLFNFHLRAAETPSVKVAVVGTGTANIFHEITPSSKQFIDVAFTPSKATGKVLASELPKHGSERSTVLYPASAKASHDIEEGLSKRGFYITRLNTYTTEPVQHVDQMILQQALSASVVAVASPSAIRAWVNLLPEPENWGGSVACIGETTASAARKLGLRSVYYPSSPGLQGWVDSILDALRLHNQFSKV